MTDEVSDYGLPLGISRRTAACADRATAFGLACVELTLGHPTPLFAGERQRS